jgi:hypothetical protein
MATAACVTRFSRFGVDEAVEIEPAGQEVETSSEEISIVVAQLKRITRCANLEFALRVGAVIIHHFYGGDTAAWRSRGPKTASFRSLARHPELPLSPGSLYRCVALFELCDRLKAPSRWEHLGASHLRMVLGLPPVAQEKMLSAANENRWSVKTLGQVILREKAVRVTRGGRRAEPPVAKSLKSVNRSLDAHRAALGDADGLSPQDIAETMRLMEETRRVLVQLAECLNLATCQSKPPLLRHAANIVRGDA